MIYKKKHWIYKDVTPESHSRIWCIRTLNFTGILALIFFLLQMIPSRRKVKKEEEVSNRGKERWQFHGTNLRRFYCLLQVPGQAF